MLQTVWQKFSGGCMMLMRRDGDAVSYLGTAFLVHQDGYLLTVAHVIPPDGALMVVPSDPGSDFLPVSQETVTPLAVEVVRTDHDRDLALLRLKSDLGISLPDHFLGSAAGVLPGASLMALGFSFGHQQLHALIALNAVVSAKVLATNGSRLILFDSMVHDGDRGGPLVSLADGLVVGVVNGRFDPAEASREFTDGSRTLAANTNISYAVAIEYGLELLAAEGLDYR